MFKPYTSEFAVAIPASLRTRFDTARAVHEISSSWTSRRESKAATVTRRAIEIALIIMVFIPLTPLLLTIMALIKLSSRGPAFFIQERVGLDGKIFRMLKFRTMRCDAENESGPVWARENDPRCTRLGGILRRWSLDELPQLVNVLRGEMSLVGPRPERPYFVQKFSRELPGYLIRHCVRPGLTGWAQIHGWRGNTSLEERLKCDLHYVRNRSLKLDLLILLKTPWIVLRARNAH